jgi:hypothetical protein
MKPKARIDYLHLLREEIAALSVVKCHMSHERIRRAGELMLPVASSFPEGSYQRVGLCSPEVRAQRLGCSHTTARIKLQDAINELNTGDAKSAAQRSSLGGELTWLNNEIHLLDHRKGEAEKNVAKLEELYRVVDRSHKEAELLEARKVVREMERLHDHYVEQIGALRDKVVNELDASLKIGQLNTGTAGVSPASSNIFTQGTVAPLNSDNVAFNESGRDARGPSKRGAHFRQS